MCKFRQGKQKALIQKAVRKAGSESKLSIALNIPKGNINNLKLEKRNLSQNYAQKLCTYLGISFSSLEIETLIPKNWGQVKGGNILVQKKKAEGTFGETINRLKMRVLIG